MPWRKRRRVAALALSVVAAVSGAQAADGTWTLLSGGSATGTWSDADTGNWAGGVVADGSGFTADFSTLDITATSTVTLGASRTIGNLIFGDTATATAGSWILAGTGTNTLTLAGTTPTITVNALGTNATTTISAVISGSNGLTKDGTGTVATSVLVLSGSNNYTGGTTISAGSVRAQNSSALGSGTVSVANGARLQLHGNVNIGNTIDINGTSALFVNNGANNVLSGAVNLLSDSSVTNTTAANVGLTFSGTVNLGINTLTANTTGSSPMTISGVINGSGGITKANDGTLTLSNNNTNYSGTTTLTRGSLGVGHDGALGTGTFAFAVGNNTAGTIRSSDATTRTIANAVTFGNGISARYLFGSTNGSFNGDLTFTSTTGIALSGLKLFEVANRTQFDAGFTGAGGITMQTTGSTGTGTLVLNGSNSYTGATTVNAGTLLVNGSLDSGSAVTVAAGATLGGGGVIGGNTTISGILSPGSSTESLAFGGNLLLQSTANTIMEINGVNRGSGTDGYDAVDLTNPAGILTYDGTLTLTMTGLIANGTYELFAFTAPAQGAFDDVVFAGAAYSGAFSESGGVWTATSDQGQVFAFDQATGNLTVVPEPSAYVLLTVGLMTVMFVRRKRSR